MKLWECFWVLWTILSSFGPPGIELFLNFWGKKGESYSLLFSWGIWTSRPRQGSFFRSASFSFQHPSFWQHCESGQGMGIVGLVYYGFTSKNMLKSTNAHEEHINPVTDSLDCKLDSVETLALVVGRWQRPSKCCLLDFDAVPFFSRDHGPPANHLVFRIPPLADFQKHPFLFTFISPTQ